MPKLIVLRGPSGAGKSTVANRLFEMVDTPIALVDLDHYRFTVRNHPPETRAEYRMAEAAIRSALDLRLDVIFEGNFRTLPDGSPPLSLLGFADAEVFAFYLDISLEETLRRHEIRSDRRITADRMVELYPAAQPIESLAEVRIGEGVSIEAAARTIREISGV